MTILWRGLMQVPLTGHQTGDGWSNLEAPDPKRQAVVQPDGMLRLECKFGDEYQNPNTGQWYTEQRALLTAVQQTTFVEGQESILFWPTLYPVGGKDWFPKQDQLDLWPDVGLNGGSCLEIHQQPAPGAPYFGDWSKMPGGSAPIYTGVSGGQHYLSLTDQKTSTSLKGFTLPLERGRKNWHYMRAKWSPDPKVGWLHYFINGVPCAFADGDPTKPYPCATMYPGCTNYLVAGFYRRASIGDPTLKWPVDAKPGVTYPQPYVPKKGALIYPAGDGEPGVQYLGTVVHCDSLADVQAEALPGAATPPVAPPSDGIEPLKIPVDPAHADQWRRLLIGLVYPTTTAKLLAWQSRLDAELTASKMLRASIAADFDERDNNLLALKQQITDLQNAVNLLLNKGQ